MHLLCCSCGEDCAVHNGGRADPRCMHAIGTASIPTPADTMPAPADTMPAPMLYEKPVVDYHTTAADAICNGHWMTQKNKGRESGSEHPAPALTSQAAAPGTCAAWSSSASSATRPAEPGQVAGRGGCGGAPSRLVPEASPRQGAASRVAVCVCVCVCPSSRRRAAAQCRDGWRCTDVSSWFPESFLAFRSQLSPAVPPHLGARREPATTVPAGACPVGSPMCMHRLPCVSVSVQVLGVPIVCALQTTAPII